MASRFLFWLLKAARPPGDRVPDSVLLERFAVSRDSAAFELLLHRHANAVWAACRRILVNDADAEDAFQATFVALMRKADSIRKPCVGGWLHRVAVNAALKLKARHGRESAVLESLTELPRSAGQSSEQDVERAELASLLQQELARLPERYRLPVVFMKVRVDVGVEPTHQWNAAQRHRLEAEAALWKVLHPKPAGK